MPNETVTPADVAELITKLREGPDVREVEDGSGAWELDPDKTGETMQEAATALEAQAAELAAKEEARAEQWRQRREAEGSRDIARAACDTMRIERDEARTALAETREALSDLLSWFPEKPSEPEWRLTAGEWGADDAVEAARRALEGGE